MLNHNKSAQIFAEGTKYIPGGVNTTHRILDPPMVFNRAQGSKIYDVDGNEYIDYHAAFSPILLGHCYPRVQERVKEAIDQFDLFGAGATELEISAAAKIVEHVPSVEKVLFCNSGSEATYHAVRLSRAVTGRKKIIKFQGCYHGWHDSLLMNVASSAEKLGTIDGLSAGSLQEEQENTIVLPFNDLDAVRDAARGGDIAMVILEPIPHNIGCLLPKPGYLAGLREICNEYGVILVFDEVITGFRHHIGGLQALWDVTPDLTTMGKAMANGYPLAAIGGKEELMDRFTTAGGDVYFSGTFNAHPASMAAVLATVEVLETENVYEHIFSLGEQMRKGLQEINDELGIEACVTGFGSAFITYFMSPPIEQYSDMLRNDKEKFIAYRRGMIERGFFMMPTNLKRNVISFSHTEDEVEQTLKAAKEVLRNLQ